MRRPSARKAERLLVEVERLERRGDGDRGMSGVEDLPEEPRRIAAENLQLQPLGGAVDQMHELVAAFAQQVRELHEAEVESDERIVFLGHASLDLPAARLEHEA